MKIRTSRYLQISIIFIALFTVVVPTVAEGTSENPMRLWYDDPASQWTEALPVGNGRLGAMVFGDVRKEHIQFNEDSLWTGIPHDYSHADAYKYLPEIRDLLFQGKQREAENLASRTFMSVPLRQERYQAFGDVWIEFDGDEEFSDYQRDLNLDNAVASVQYQKNNVFYTRSVFSSFPDQVLVIHLTSGKAKKLNLVVSMTSPHKKSQVIAQADTLVLKGRVSGYWQSRQTVYHPSILTFESRLKVYECDGNIFRDDNKIHITKANAITLVLAAATSYVNYHDVSANPAERCETVLDSVNGDYETLIKRHIEDHQSLFRRVSIDLGTTEQAQKPTDERILNFRKGVFTPSAIGAGL